MLCGKTAEFLMFNQVLGIVTNVPENFILLFQVTSGHQLVKHSY
jgi:hypothetical protein